MHKFWRKKYPLQLDPEECKTYNFKNKSFGRTVYRNTYTQTDTESHPHPVQLNGVIRTMVNYRVDKSNHNSLSALRHEDPEETKHQDHVHTIHSSHLRYSETHLDTRVPTGYSFNPEKVR